MEEWVNLGNIGFPNYAISNLGNVRNEKTGRMLSQSVTQSGSAKVGLMSSHLGMAQQTVAVTPLVAYAFLPDPPNHRFNTPINVDGDRSNNCVDNLMWRPRWFAVKYHMQFHNDIRGFSVPIIEIHTEEKFETSWDAAVKYGLLDIEIAVAAMNRTYVFPTNQEFRVLSY